MTEYDTVIWRPDLATMRMVQGRWVMDARRVPVYDYRVFDQVIGGQRVWTVGPDIPAQLRSEQDYPGFRPDLMQTLWGSGTS